MNVKCISKENIKLMQAAGEGIAGVIEKTRILQFSISRNTTAFVLGSVAGVVSW